MHPDDAAARGLRDGDAVRVFNDLGEVQVPLRLTRELRRGVVSLPKGLWRSSTLNGSTATALVPDTLTDIGGGSVLQRRAGARSRGAEHGAVLTAEATRQAAQRSPLRSSASSALCDVYAAGRRAIMFIASAIIDPTSATLAGRMVVFVGLAPARRSG